MTSLGSIAVLFLVAKFMGHKQIAQLDFFDYITGITIGSIAAEMATELEEPWKPLVAMILYGGVTILMSTMSKKFPRMRKYLNGTPTILMDHGKLYRENLSKAKLDLSEFMVMCRQQGYFDLSNIQPAIFEYNPQQELLFTELIMDGRILEGNLKRMGLDLTWLNRQLSERNIHSPREVFLAVCDRNLKLVLFKNIQNEREGGGRDE